MDSDVCMESSEIIQFLNTHQSSLPTWTESWCFWLKNHTETPIEVFVYDWPAFRSLDWIAHKILESGHHHLWNFSPKRWSMPAPSVAIRSALPMMSSASNMWPGEIKLLWDQVRCFQSWDQVVVTRTWIGRFIDRIDGHYHARMHWMCWEIQHGFT